MNGGNGAPGQSSSSSQRLFQTQQAGGSGKRLSLAGAALASSGNSMNPRHSLAPPAKISKNSFSNLIGEVSSMNIQGRMSLGGGRASLSSRQSLASSASGVTGRPSFAPRTSTSGLESGRTSGGGYKSSVAVPSIQKDPRNIRDKNFILSGIKLLIEFLAKNGYDKPISQKILTSPSAKDFQYIFRYLYLQLDPSYEFASKFEDEVLMLVKLLRYPFANDISKSQLQAVGSLHTWPVLLGMLVWMVELIVCYQNISIDFLENSPEASLFEYLLKGYQSFVDGNEDIHVMKTELISRFEQSHIPILKENELLKKQLSETQASIEALEVDGGVVAKLQKENNEYRSDLDRFNKYIRMLETKRDKLIDSVQREKEEEAAILEEIRVLEEEKKALQMQVDSQQICPEDVERINGEKEMLLKTIDTLNQQKDEANKLFWEREMTFQKKFDAIERSFQEFNHFGEKIGIIPVDAPYSKGISFELSLNPQAPRPEQIISPSLKELVQPSLVQLRDHLNDLVHTSQDTFLSLQEQLDTLSDTINEKQEEFKNIQERIKKYHQQYMEEKEIHAAESKKRAEEMEALESELLRIRTETSNSYLSSQQLLQKANLDFENIQMKMKEENEMLSGEIVHMLDELIDFKMHIENSLADLKCIAEREAATEFLQQQQQNQNQSSSNCTNTNTTDNAQ